MDSSSSITPASTLEMWARLSWQDGIQVESLERLETVQVRTRNSTYEITVLSPATGDVLVRGGRFFPGHTQAHVAGSSLGGSFLKLRGIYVGFSLELTAGGERIVTTRVRSITRVTDQRVQ